MIPFPIAMKDAKITCNGKEVSNRDAIQFFSVHSIQNTGFHVLSKRADGSMTNDWLDFIAVGHN